MERKTVRFEIKAIDQDTGVIEGYGATFSNKPDKYNDIIDLGCFTKTLKENADSIVSLFNHNIMEPIGLPELRQDSNGLYAKIRLVMELQKARDTLALARAGVIKSLSIGYDTIKSDFVNGVRHLKEVRLYDVSPVIFAANPEARILSVKDLDIMSNADLNDVERSAMEEMKRRISKNEGGIPEMELKPYTQEHACRLRDPGDFKEDSFRRMSRENDGKKYSVIMGRLKGEDTMTEQAYRYNKDTWDADEAKTHCGEHDGKFEPAEKEGKSGRVLSAASIGKVRAAFEALQALLNSAEIEDEPKKSTHLDNAGEEAAELDGIIAGLKSENAQVDLKDAESRIDSILARIRATKN